MRKWMAKNWKWCIGILVGCGCLGALIFLPVWRVSSFYWLSHNEQATLENEYRKTIAQIFGGIGIFIGLYLTWKQMKVNEDGKITERFTCSISHLGNQELDIRLGGIYALERIAKDSPKDHPQIMEIISAFIRGHSKASVTIDVKAALTVIGRRNIKFDRGARYLIDLRDTILQKVDLRGLNMQKLNLLGANMKEACLLRTNLSGTFLGMVNLQGADMREANLDGAYLTSANLTGADLDSIKGWEKIKDMKFTNIHSVRNSPPGFIEFAKLNGAIEM